MEKKRIHPVENVTNWIGSTASLVLHTVAFIAAFVVGAFHIAAWDMVLLILTTAVSLEAIYLAIFIQMTINQHTESLREVEENIDDIQEDVEDIQEDIDDIQEDVEDIQEEDALEEKAEIASLDTLARDVRTVLAEIEDIKKKYHPL